MELPFRSESLGMAIVKHQNWFAPEVCAHALRVTYNRFQWLSTGAHHWHWQCLSLWFVLHSSQSVLHFSHSIHSCEDRCACAQHLGPTVQYGDKGNLNERNAMKHPCFIITIILPQMLHHWWRWQITAFLIGIHLKNSIYEEISFVYTKRIWFRLFW